MRQREIERKFLVDVSPQAAWRAAPAVLYRQGYLHTGDVSTVRVRVVGDAAWLTIKGRTQGLGRDEYEYAIPAPEAEGLLDLCAAGRVEKWRRVIEHQGHCWEVDEFVGANAGLVVAEIELNREDQSFPRPEWVRDDVSTDKRYANASLARTPYMLWGL